MLAALRMDLKIMVVDRGASGGGAAGKGEKHTNQSLGQYIINLETGNYISSRSTGPAPTHVHLRRRSI